MPKCMVKGCPHKTGEKAKHPDIILHMFPSSIERVKAWLKSTGHVFEDLDGFAEIVIEDKKGFKFRICSTHFKDEEYIAKGSRKVLLESAIPELNLQHDTTVVVERFLSRTYKKAREDRPAHIYTSSTIGTATALKVERSVNTVRVETRDVGTQTERALVIGKEMDYIGEPSLKESGRIFMEHSYHLKPSRPMLCESAEATITADTYVNSPNATLNNSVAGQIQRMEEMVKNVGVDIPSFLNPRPSKETTVIEGPSERSERDDYEPLESELFDGSKVISEENIVYERKFIVFESCLDLLFSKLFCGAGIGCTCPVQSFKKDVRGTFLSVTGVCQAGHSFLLWESQPLVRDVPSGNLLFSASVLLSGSSFQKVEEITKIFGIQRISESSYCKHQRQYLFPSIHHEWRLEQKEVKGSLVGKALCIGGDGQCDSPSHRAKYCVYTMIDLQSNKVVDFEVVQLGQGSSSVAMEEKAFETCLDRMLEDNLDVRILATGRHASVRKTVTEKYPHLKHQFDVCRYAKSIQRKLVAASQKKLCKELGVWTDSIIKHFWWSVLTCKGDENVLREKWRSILNHVSDVHEWHYADHYHRCAHRELSAEQKRGTLWLRNDTRAFETLCDIINSPQITKDLGYLTHFCHTGPIENLHSHMLKFRPKKIHFEIDAVYARTALAVLEHNNNLKREQAVVHGNKKHGEQTGIRRTKLCPKTATRWSVRNAYEWMSPSHLDGMLISAVRMCNGSLVTD